jgi:NADPH:quinone reductase-like Zn-dependent oxidoreductase
MKAFVYGANGAEIADVAKPAPKGTQVLVRVRACGLNRADLGMTSQPASRQDCRDAVASGLIQTGTVCNNCCCK